MAYYITGDCHAHFEKLNGIADIGVRPFEILIK